MADDQRRIPSLGTGIALIFLTLLIVGVTWWLNRPEGGNAPGPALPDLDVVCLGRIDGKTAVINLDAPMPGRVAKVFVMEGSHVDAKAELVKLDDEFLKLRQNEAEAAITATDIEVEAANLELKLHPIRKGTQEAALAAAAERIVAARRVYEEKKAARPFGTITAAELLAAESEVKQLEQLESIEKARLEELKLADPKLKVRAAEAKRTVAQLTLKQAEKAVADCILLAPSNGTILRVHASVGELIAPGTPQPPILFRPDGPLVVRAELEQEFLGRVKSGMKATIRDDARSESPTWNGKVDSVGLVVARKRAILLEPGELNDVRTVECVISLEGDTSGLLVGQRMRVRLGRGE